MTRHIETRSTTSPKHYKSKNLDQSLIVGGLYLARSYDGADSS